MHVIHPNLYLMIICNDYEIYSVLCLDTCSPPHDLMSLNLSICLEQGRSMSLQKKPPGRSDPLCIPGRSATCSGRRQPQIASFIMTGTLQQTAIADFELLIHHDCRAAMK